MGRVQGGHCAEGYIGELQRLCSRVPWARRTGPVTSGGQAALGHAPLVAVVVILGLIPHLVTAAVPIASVRNVAVLGVTRVRRAHANARHTLIIVAAGISVITCEVVGAIAPASWVLDHVAVLALGLGGVHLPMCVQRAADVASTRLPSTRQRLHASCISWRQVAASQAVTHFAVLCWVVGPLLHEAGLVQLALAQTVGSAVVPEGAGKIVVAGGADALLAPHHEGARACGVAPVARGVHVFRELPRLIRQVRVALALAVEVQDGAAVLLHTPSAAEADVHCACDARRASVRVRLGRGHSLPHLFQHRRWVSVLGQHPVSQVEARAASSACHGCGCAGSASAAAIEAVPTTGDVGGACGTIAICAIIRPACNAVTILALAQIASCGRRGNSADAWPAAPSTFATRHSCGT